MKQRASFTAIHKLMTRSTWAEYWKLSGKNQEDLYKFYPQYIASLAHKIKESQVKRIFLIHEDRAAFLAGFLATLHAGVVVVLPQSDAPGLLKDLLRLGDGILSDKEALATLTPCFINMNKMDFDPSPKFKDIDPNNTFVTFYTSGSTGTPKEIKKSLKQLENEISTLDELWGEPATFLSTVPQNHIYGLLFSLLWPVCGSYPIRCETFSYWEDLLSHAQANSIIISSPSHLGRLPLTSENLKLKNVFSSGGHLTFEDSNAAHHFFGRLPIEVYGSTETGGIAYRKQVQKEQPWVHFKNIELTVGDHDRLCIQSPYLPDTSVFQTEDRITLLENGSFHLLGRADRIAKVEGKRVCLLEIEQRLEALHLIQQAHIIPFDTTRRNELGAVVVLSNQGQEELIKKGKIQFVRDLREGLLLYFDAIVLPRKWRFVPEIPLNAQGKTSHSVLKACFGG